MTTTPINSRFASDTAGKEYDFLGIDDFLPTPCSDTAIKMTGINAMSGKECMELSLTDRTKLWKEISRGMHLDKFRLVDELTGLESLVTMENIVRFEDLIIKLYKYIAFYGLLNVFYIMEFDAIGRPCPFSESSKCVLVDYHSLEDYEVEELVDYFLCFGSEYHQENLKWSYDAILNSCTPDLRDILAGKMQVYSDDRKTGPILFMLLVSQLTNVSPQASRIMVNKVIGMKMSDFEGKSITLVNKTLNAAHKWLTMIHHLPPDFVLIVLDIYETISVPYFARYLDTIELHSINAKHMLGHDQLMEMAAKFYEEA
jgi:hypothetical protein